ncbi:MAG: ribosomal protein S18-alanine N-acetyltransferase [Methylophilaceae bacterium]
MSAVLAPNCLLRPMLEEDLDAVMQIEPTLYSHPWTRGNFIDSITSGHSAWVMMLEGKIIGYTVVMSVLDEATLLNISIVATYQKQGLGRVLLQSIVDRAKVFNILNIFLEVRANNAAAIALYEHMGFVEKSIRRGYYPTKDGREDAILMGLLL